jgi:hypothetical protein
LATPNYDINYNDERFTKVNNDKNAALSDLEKTYGGMISGSEGYFQDQIDATNKWGETQKQNQQVQTDFAIEQIEQQKAQAHKDYTKEQSGAYTDWQKQSNAYGANAEQMASMGMAGTGYSESAQVSMFNTYQNRVVAARESFTRAVLNYDNAIKDARLQNNAALAQIAYDTLQKTLELSLQGFQYKNQLIIERANKKTELDQIYHSRYQDVLEQINKENALAEEVRQYNEKMAEEKRQFDQNQNLARNQLKFEKQKYAEQMALEKEKFAWQKSQAAKSSSSGGSSGGSIKKSSSSSGSSKSSSSGSSKITSNRSGGGGKFGSSTTSAKEYLNALIASGANKDKVSNEIALALRGGAISKSEAAALRKTFTPRGVQYPY